MLRNKCAKVVLRVLSSWEVEGGSSLVQYKILFVQIFHIVFFMKRIFVYPLPKLVRRSHSVLRHGRSGYEIISLRSHSLSQLFFWILFVLSQWELHCSCLKPLVLSNVVQGGSLSPSIQDYYCSLKNRALMDKIMWSSELQSVTLLRFCTCPPHPQSIERYQQKLRLYG